jgi:lysophospholipase L1-like esterase
MNNPSLEQLDPALAVAHPHSHLLWYDLLSLGLEGQGWTDLAHSYDRLPARAEGVVTEGVWALSHHTAGIGARFVTDATEIAAHWVIRGERLAMDHMPATGMSGIDLYVRWEGVWRWLGIGRATNLPDNEAGLVSGMPEGMREYRVYLPLYNGVDSVKIGVNKEARVCRIGGGRREAGGERGPQPGPPGGEGRGTSPRPTVERPLVFYGTSITQGGCASRPGMAHPAILGRWLERPVINLGFSGNGRMEPAMGELLAELDPAVYVLECLPNLSPEEAEERVEPFVTNLRAARPDTPIVLVESITYQNAYLVTAGQDRYGRQNRYLRELYARLAPGDPKLHYLEGAGLLGDDGEGTVDGVHPTDLGFLRIAEGMVAGIGEALG